LAAILNEMAIDGFKILISNANHESIYDLYSSPCWNIKVINRRTNLASNSFNRGETSELVIHSNF
jgi:hypothetical protein